MNNPANSNPTATAAAPAAAPAAEKAKKVKPQSEMTRDEILEARSTKHPQRYKDVFNVKNISKGTLSLTHGKIKRGEKGVATRAEVNSSPKALKRLSDKPIEDYNEED